MKQLLMSLLFISISLFGEDRIELDYELDIYYTNISAFLDLDTANDITDASNYSEAQLYKGLVLNSLSPNIFLVEAAIHPLSLGGLYIREEEQEYYEKAQTKDINLIKSMTAGFEEPYSLSFFFGRMMVFKKKDSDYIGKNRAFIGYLISIGNYSIKDNVAQRDNWVNFEFKLKGTRNKKNRDLDWSFRVGSRIHSNHDFVDTIYIGARRKSIDYKKSVYSLIYNSAFSAMIAVDTKEFKLSEAEFIVEKMWPVDWAKKMSIGLGVGYLYYSDNKYRGKLIEEGVDNHQFIFRPNLKW